jgi:hypothetical protein
MTNENQSDEKTVLKGEQALKLWREGKDEWNQWVEENPVADVDFSGVDFGKDPKNHIPKNNFEGFKFPKGKVDFSRVTFYQLDASQNEQNVSFMNAHLGDGEVTFEK